MLLGRRPVALADQLGQAPLRSDAPPAGLDRLVARRLRGLGHGPRHDLVEHLGHDRQRLVAGQGDQALVERGVGEAEGLRIVDAGLLLVDQPEQLLAADRRRDDRRRVLRRGGLQECCGRR